MHHGMDLDNGYALLIAALMIGTGGVVAVSVFLARRHKRQSHSRERASHENASGVEHEEAYTLEEQVLYLMRQKGGPVLQGDLCTELKGESRDVAQAVHDVEQAHLIRRDWQPDKADYAVVLTEE